MRKNLTAAAAAALVVGMSGAAAAETLRASHQWPGGTGDMRDEMVQIIAKEMEKSDTGVTVRVYPGESLVKAKEQWGALTGGQIDISAFPLAYAAGRHPEFNATLMPALVKSHEHAKRLNDSEFMQDIKDIMNEAGVMVLADTWLAGGFVGKEGCIVEPADVKGKSTRAAGSSFEEMLAEAGASIASMPSSEIYTAMQTGVLDAANTSSESFVSYRIYEQVECLTPPGDTALWFMYEPIVMSKESFESLSPEAQEAIKAAGDKAEEYAAQAAKDADENMVKVFKENDVEIATMTPEQFQAWRDIAAKSSYKNFAESVPNGQELIDKALSVD
ncbi:TRAP transporter solute receptor protein [Caenispirillum salinarum AK4]|uniref:TRAP transporter solute receptor protein n=1 Tax=Caenispirillum salinarum AK4 TaxID=1238182 RepID=K9HLT3_9PROT|nr:TRAP transporter substrate-binding protein DctP [Caenispirillum salinarum]EKV29516.1 TRAP transporter solute receptor protein [Caenispirillum salinarum AK4]